MAEPNSLLYPTKPSIRQRQLGAGILSTFLYRALLVAAFVVALPLLPSRAPEFVDGTLLTRTWELLHLLLVGIAISYGLFSRRNADADADAGKDAAAAAGKHGAAQSYVPQILRGPSAVFGDDDDGVDGDDDHHGDRGVRAWSSQYYPNDPVVVVAKGSGSAGSGGGGGDEPLLLPVRSLKSRPREADSGRNGFSRSPDEEDAVLSSPIPWRSRSGRLESKVEESGALNRTSSFRSPGVRSTSATSTSPSNASPKRGFYKSTPPPPPPPPPPPFVGHLYSPAPDRKITKKSFKDELKDVSAKPLTKPQSSINTSSSIAKSVRTVRPKEAQAAQAMDSISTMNGPEIPALAPNYRRKEDSEFVDKMVLESDDSDSRDSDSSEERETDDDDDDDDIIAESSGKEDEAPSFIAKAKAEAEADDSEVDKKADEFIAKFREQIRLQRIDSIKRSTRRRSDKHPK